MISAVRVRVEGTVQGVGFRPFVYREARSLRLRGFVLNDERGVLIHVEGSTPAVRELLERLRSHAPPLARVEFVTTSPADFRGAATFEIVASESHGSADAPVAPDTATCEDCLHELLDPADRRYRYPFINCTNCGPRFTIVTGVPYDRSLTTMAGFAMCAACQAEFDDPADRRFHAQPNACPQCGPRVWLARAGSTGGSEEGDAIAVAAAALLEGAIVAVKGVGGFHLACRADSEEAVSTLRSRKHREDRPFALMVPTLEAARALVDLDAPSEALLLSPARPITLAPRRGEWRLIPDMRGPAATHEVAEAVAPGAPELGLMLPYSGLHHVLLRDAGVVLVMTSGNVSDEPIAYRDGDALGRLGEVADLFLLHDRPIHTRTDDGVVRVVRGRRLTLRRSRGDVPDAIALGVGAARHVLAVGAELKSTFCVARGRRAWVGPHIGDLKNLETLESFTEGVAHFERLFAVTPELVAHDLHPDYLSTRYALERDGVELVGVQHHWAHLAAVLAEHGATGPAVGAIYDGTGYGTDGTVWGGEILVGDLSGFERAGHLHPVRLPGGDRAVREPWRMAAAWLAAAGAGDEESIPARLRDAVEPKAWTAIWRMATTGTAAPVTTSAGRLFDAVAAIAGVRATANYEGQAAIELEAAADPREEGTYELPLARAPDAPAGSVAAGAPDLALILDPRPAVEAVAADAAAGVAAGAISARFHRGFAAATAAALVAVAGERGLDTVVLSGGVFANRLMLARTADLLEQEGLRVLVPALLPPGDGGISYGQAAIAAQLSASR